MMFAPFRLSGLLYEISRFGSRNCICSNFHSSTAMRSYRFSRAAKGLMDKLYRRISAVGDPNVSIVPILDQWFQELQSVDEHQLKSFIKELRRYKCPSLALQLKKKKKSYTRILRTAGFGTWKARNKTQVKDEDGRVLWLKKDFLFEVNKKNSSSTDNGHWLMTEFSLHDDEVANNYVLCKIWNKHGRSSHKEKEEIIEEEEVNALESKAAVVPSLQKKRKFSGEEVVEDQCRKKMAIYRSRQDSESVDNGINTIESVPLSVQVPTYELEATSEESYPYSYPIPIADEAVFPEYGVEPEYLIAEQVSIPEFGVVPEYPIAEEDPFPEYGVAPEYLPIPEYGVASDEYQNAEDGGKSPGGDLTTLFSEIDEESRRVLDAELDRLLNEFAPDIAVQQNEFTPPPLTHLSAVPI